MSYWLTRRARRDLLHIWNHIAEDSVRAADRFIDRLVRHSGCLARRLTPAGARDEIRPGYRSLAVDEYLVFYRIAQPGVRIMHVLHGRMHLGNYRFE